MRTIRDVSQLDKMLEEIQTAAKQSDDAMRLVFSGFSMHLEETYPIDPFSKEYADFQKQLYEKLAGKTYAVTNEVTAFDVSASVRQPFPYSSRSTATTGTHLSAMGFFISTLQLPPGSRVLEFGPGWGNTTIALAKLGFQMTAVDIEANFCDLIRTRAGIEHLAIDVVNADFFWSELVTEPYDAILFYECFHHCSDHIRLLNSLHKALKPAGKVYLGCEPINSQFELPWGLRMDGEALWAIRQNGWMELGFNDVYFREALRRTGWSARTYQSKDVGWASVWELQPTPVRNIAFSTSESCMGTIVGRRENGHILIENSSAGYLLYGPYVAMTPGFWRVSVYFPADTIRSGAVVLEAFSLEANQVFGQQRFQLQEIDETGTMDMLFSLPTIYRDVEIRLLCEAGVSATIGGIILLPS